VPWAALAVAVAALILHFIWPGMASAILTLAAAAGALVIATRVLRYPRLYVDSGAVLAALAIAGMGLYFSVGNLLNARVVRHTFQLEEPWDRYVDDEGRWSVARPARWTHEARRDEGSVTHTFKPSRVTPPMYFSVTVRTDAGVSDLETVVENFFINLPKEKDMSVLQSEPLRLETGHDAYRFEALESEQSMRLKTENLLVMDDDRVFFLTVCAPPRWFERHREALSKLLYSLQTVPAS